MTSEESFEVDKVQLISTLEKYLAIVKKLELSDFDRLDCRIDLLKVYTELTRDNAVYRHYTVGKKITFDDRTGYLPEH